MKTLYTIWILHVCVLMSCDQKTIVKGDLLIKGGKIIDGTGSAGYHADILVAGDSILWIGKSHQIIAETQEILDATGKMITPGFIDLHAHGNPKQEKNFSNFLAQGVTSICLGMDGGSIIEGNIGGWMATHLDSTFGVNLLPFTGHAAARITRGWTDEASLNLAQINLLASDLAKDFDAGCWGLSIGLEYLPGFYADSAELRILAETVGQYNGLITSHIRNEDDDQVDQSIVEMGALSPYARTNISHIKVVFGQRIDRAKEIINLLDQYNLTADLYPYTASYTGIGIVFPNWAKKPKEYAKIKKLRSTELATYLREKVNQRGGPEATLFGTAPYKGKTLKDLADEYDLPFEIVLMDIIGPYGGSAAYFVMNEGLQRELLLSERVMLSSDGSSTMHHPRGYGSQAKLIEEFVVRDSVLTLEKAVHKMTGQIANVLQLQDRGFIRIGQKADLCLFDPQDIRAHANFEEPHLLATGMYKVFINGQEVYSDGSVQDQHGRILIKSANPTIKVH